MKRAYDFTDYREYLTTILPVSGPQRGARNRLAEALNCQKGFVSQVLSGRSHFSLEHGMKISKFLQLDPNEEEYFLLLLHKSRAGSKELEKFYDGKLSEIQDRLKQIKERIRSDSHLSESEQLIYYSSWAYTAVHMCLMIPELGTTKAISKFLGLSIEATAKVLDFLLQAGFAIQDADRFKAGPVRIHLPNNSPLVGKHHTNWRMSAIDSLDAEKGDDLHYSLVMSISDTAARKVLSVLLQAVQDIEPIVKEARDETVYTLNLDLFSLKKQ
jgi:uncharacterized protein (TIGR02147 family)